MPIVSKTNICVLNRIKLYHIVSYRIISYQIVSNRIKIEYLRIISYHCVSYRIIIVSLLYDLQDILRKNPFFWEGAFINPFWILF